MIEFRCSIKQEEEVSHGVYNRRYRSRKAGVFDLCHGRARADSLRTTTDFSFLSKPRSHPLNYPIGDENGQPSRKRRKKSSLEESAEQEC